MNKFEDYFFHQNKPHLVYKWHHYFEVYDNYFKKFIGKNPVVLEIGVSRGGSLDMWNYYFDKNCSIYGFDIDSSCKQYENQNIKIIIGDQNNKNHLDNIIKDLPPIDIIIDDGSHIQEHIINSFTNLYNHINPGGVYLIEDLHTAYWSSYGGGYKLPSSFIEYSKNLIDEVNSWHHNGCNKYEHQIKSIHYHDSICVITKPEIISKLLATMRGPGI